MHNHQLTKTILVFSASALFACGGTSFSSGVDGSKKLSELDEADAAKICMAAADTSKDWAEDHKDGFCMLGAVAGAAFASIGGGDPTAACEMLHTDCLAKPAETSSEQCSPNDGTCDATVEEMETCFNDALDSIGKSLDEIGGKSCADNLMSNSSLSLEDPASCKAIQAKCPSASFGSPSTGTSSTS